MSTKHPQSSESNTLSIFSYNKLFLVTLTLLLMPGCGYPDVSEKTYEISKALYSACNRQSDEQLLKVEKVISSASESQEISSKEERWLKGIIKTARDGDWQTATRETRKLMEDQIKF